MNAQPCDDCGQPERSAIHRRPDLRHYHHFSIPLMDRPASEFPDGWPPELQGMICGESPATPEARAHDMELIRRQAWKWIAEAKWREGAMRKVCVWCLTHPARWPSKNPRVAPRWCSQLCAAQDALERVERCEDVFWCHRHGWNQDHGSSSCYGTKS